MRVLFVEDEKSPDRVRTDLLITSGYQVARCSVGEADIEASRQQEFDLMILQVASFGLGEIELCRRLRASGLILPILVLTSRSEGGDRITALECGADDYLTQPYDSPELLARVGALLRRASIGRMDDLRSFEFAGKKVDFIKSELRSDGRVVDLSERESRLLKYFIKHQGEVVTREALLRDVWGYQFIPKTRTVDTHIVWLRQKIEKDFRNPQHLLTVYGQGYRFAI